MNNALLEIAGVRQAVTFGIPHATPGEDVVSTIVLKPGFRISEQSVLENLFTRLVAFKVPSQVFLLRPFPEVTLESSNDSI